MPHVRLNFEGVFGYGVTEPEEAAHFFEHTLGLAPAGEEGGLRFYGLGSGLAVAVDVSGASAGEPPYLLFSAPDITAAAEHFLQRGCAVRELPWATGSGFLARSPEGHTVCVIQAQDGD
jgi:predicted enzyme related to lactoylglutathione lyase